jgi:hypothetical protein
MTKIPIKPDDVLVPGDVVELIFKLSGPSWLWLQATQVAALENRLKKNYPNFFIQSREWLEDEGRLIVTVKVVKPEPAGPDLGGNRQEAGIAVAVTAVAIAAAIMTASIMWWLSLEGTNKIIQTATPAISLLAVAAILYFAVQLFGKGGFAK